MVPEVYVDYLAQFKQALEGLQVTKHPSMSMGVDEGFHSWCEATRQLRAGAKTMYFIGNGASAMMASHMAADASKNGGFRAQAFNDAALLTAVSNDIDFSQCFAMPLKRHADEGDLLVAISSSGRSLNILEGIRAAKHCGMKVITLTGMGADNPARRLGAINFYVGASTYGLVESAHQLLLHCWLDTYMALYHESEV
jgi:D-sedoheptulose 7-phosphate isomerase